MSIRGSGFLAAVATSALVALTACGSEPSGEPGAAPADPSRASPTAVSPSPSPTPSLIAGVPPGAEVLGKPSKGEPFTLTITYTDNPEPAKLQLTVNSVTCGKPLDQRIIAAAAESIGEPTPTPTPEGGKQYCVVVIEVMNTGNSETIWDTNDTVTLNVDAVRYSQTQEDTHHVNDYQQYWASKGERGPAFGLNPGSKGPAAGIFQIPVGATPTSMWVTSGTAIENLNGVQPGYLVQL
ncbi:DUF4352 domain-containing protein [Planomonospora sp. ID82291]|uniref:DUF4352 domain-containing protein n=1 Tax=Planomonospora sp. ID82291 TaxID=2738136 RepID=UPI0018C360DF|nr:DUF4352 domain-containing protein [Planomonospora sp. ID82291]MBG0818736.1 DUF4352 domain-containing protein [Planomonospora sp. ID82291]